MSSQWLAEKCDDFFSALQVLALVAGSASFIRSVHGWKTVCALIAVTSLHPEAAPVSMNALASVARPSALSPVAFTPVLEAVVSCIERNAKVSWTCQFSWTFEITIARWIRLHPNNQAFASHTQGGEATLTFSTE